MKEIFLITKKNYDTAINVEFIANAYKSDLILRSKFFSLIAQLVDEVGELGGVELEFDVNTIRIGCVNCNTVDFEKTSEIIAKNNLVDINRMKTNAVITGDDNLNYISIAYNIVKLNGKVSLNNRDFIITLNQQLQ